MNEPKYSDVCVDFSNIDGNVFAIIGTISGALKKAGYREAAKEFSEAAFGASSYDEVLTLAIQTVNVS